MEIHTRPVPTPKPARPSRHEALESGELVSGEELGLARLRVRLGALGRGLTLRIALSEGLLAAAEEIPFTQLRMTSVERRLADVVSRAQSALERAESGWGERLLGALLYGFALDFPVALRSRAGDPRYRFVRLHCGPDETGALVATLGAPEELPAGMAA